jgi:hypothetical protein
MKRKPSTKKGGSGKTSLKKDTQVLSDNQSILSTSSVRKKEAKALKK